MRIPLATLHRRLDAHASLVFVRSKERTRLARFYNALLAMFKAHPDWDWPRLQTRCALAYYKSYFDDSEARLRKALGDIADLVHCARTCPAAQLHARLVRFGATQAALRAEETESLRQLKSVVRLQLWPVVRHTIVQRLRRLKAANGTHQAQVEFQLHAMQARLLVSREQGVERIAQLRQQQQALAGEQDSLATALARLDAIHRRGG